MKFFIKDFSSKCDQICSLHKVGYDLKPHHKKEKKIFFFLAFNNYLYIKKLEDPSSIVGSFWNPLKTVSVNVSNFYSRLISTK